MEDQPLEREDDPGLAEVAVSAAGGDAEQASLLDSLAAQRDEIASAKEVFIPIPGYEASGMTLLARYRLMSGDEVEAIGRKVTRQFKKGQRYERNVYATIDMMIAACSGIFVDRDGEKIQLKHNGNEIDGYDESLSEALKFEASSARECVLGVFGNNIIAVQSHSLLLGRWMSDTSTDVMSEMLEGNL